MGNSLGQFDINKIKKEIKTLSAIKKLGLYHLLKLSIKIRESNFIKYTKTDIYNCINITECDREVKLFKANKRLTPELYNKLQLKYASMIQNSIKTFFSLLKKGEYTIAKDYITKDNVNINTISKKSKGKSIKKSKGKSKSKSIKKTKKIICLKNLLYNSKETIGHLLIFIEIYKCIDIIKDTI